MIYHQYIIDRFQLIPDHINSNYKFWLTKEFVMEYPWVIIEFAMDLWQKFATEVWDRLATYVFATETSIENGLRRVFLRRNLIRRKYLLATVIPAFATDFFIRNQGIACSCSLKY